MTSPTTATATITVAASAAAGPRSVTVTTGAEKAAGTPFSVIVPPAGFARIAGVSPASAGPGSTCP